MADGDLHLTFTIPANVLPSGTILTAPARGGTPTRPTTGRTSEPPVPNVTRPTQGDRGQPRGGSPARPAGGST